MPRVIPFVLFPVAGAVAAGLRYSQRLHAFTSEGLVIPGQGVTVALIVLSVVVVLGALLYSARCRVEPDEKIAAREGGAASSSLAIVAGFFLLVGGAATALTSLELTAFVLRIAWLVLAALFVISGALLVVRAVRLRRDSGASVGGLLLLPAFTCCLWLVLLYQGNAADPILMDYVFQLFAAVCSLLGMYFLAGRDYGVRRPRRCVFFCLLAGYFALLCMADPLTSGARVVLVALLLYLLLQAGLLSLGGKERRNHGG